MRFEPTVHPTAPEIYQALLADLRELCACHELDTGLIEASRDLHELLDRVLDEYERRLAVLRSATTDLPPARETAAGLSALVDFASRAAALGERGEPARELRRRADELERLNGEIERELRDEGRGSGERAAQVLATLERRLPAARRKGEGSEPGRREKLEKLFQALGVLGHKINNPLTALMGRAQILQFKKGADPHAAKAGEVIEDSAKRIASYVRELVQVVREGREELLGSSSDAATPESPEQEGQHERED